MKTIYVGNLAPEAQEEQVQALFSQHGRVRAIKLARDVFSGNCRGFGFIQMEGHEARAAIAALNGKSFLGRPLKVNEEKARAGRGRGRR
jgi:RNA-binding proteins (RRM domain)